MAIGFSLLGSLIFGVAVYDWGSPDSGDVDEPLRPAPMNQTVLPSWAESPIRFERNQGQFDASVEFMARTGGYALALNPTRAILGLRRTAKEIDQPAASTSRTTVLQMKLVGGNRQAHLEGVNELPGKASYLLGNDSSSWRTSVSSYAKVRSREVYPHIDLLYYGTQRQVEYDFVVAPGGEPKNIMLDFEGADRVWIDSQGDLVLSVQEDEIRQTKPYVYQEIDGSRIAVSAIYRSLGENRVGFQVASYDPNRALVIDPVLSYSSYLGGSDWDLALGVTVDKSGNTYLVGETFSTDFMTQAALQGSKAGPDDSTDAFVAKLNKAGDQIIYSTYLGGSGFDTGVGVAVDGSGNAHVTGFTSSNDFPMANAFQSTYGGGATDVFVSKLNSSGDSLLYSTYLGGSGGDQTSLVFGSAIAVNQSGEAYVTGFTDSDDLPVTNGAFQTVRNGEFDGFVARFRSAGDQIRFCTYLGGSDWDIANSIALDSKDRPFITGVTASDDFPTKKAVQGSFGGGIFDAFVTRLSTNGKKLQFSTFLGGKDWDEGTGIVADDSGVYITGGTASTDFPVTKAVFQDTNAGGDFDSFVTKLKPNGKKFVYSTYLGGSGYDETTGIGVDDDNTVYLSGVTDSADFPTLDPIQGVFGGGDLDGFISVLHNSGQALTHSTYLGGSQTDGVVNVAVVSPGIVSATGITASGDFPIQNAFQGALSGFFDAFVLRVEQIPATTTTTSSTTTAPLPPQPRPVRPPQAPAPPPRLPPALRPPPLLPPLARVLAPRRQRPPPQRPRQRRPPPRPRQPPPQPPQRLSLSVCRPPLS